MSTNSRNFVPGIELVPNVSSQVSSMGDLDVDSTSTKINYHNGTTSSHIVTEIHPSQGASRLQFKDLDASNVQWVDPTDTTKVVNNSIAAATTGTSTQLIFMQTANRQITFPDATGTLVLAGSGGVITNQLLDESSVWFVDHTDITKAFKFNVSGATTGTSVTLVSNQAANINITLPLLSGTLSTLAGVETLTNKTINSPIIHTPTVDTLTANGANITVESPLTLNESLDLVQSVDSTTTGSATTLSAFTTSYVILTNGSLASLSGIPMGANGQYLVLTNATGGPVLINNEDSSITPDNRIRTGASGAFITVNQDASVILIYDNDFDRWRVAGGSSGGGGGGGGSGSGAIPIDLYDAIDTTLPSSSSTLIDGQTVTNGDLVLFSNLSSGNNEVYKAALSGGATTLPNPLQMAIQNTNPYAGGTVETVVAGVATPQPANDAYFEVDAATGGGSSIVASYSTAHNGIVLSTTTIWASQPFIPSASGTITAATVTLALLASGMTGNIQCGIFTDNSGVPGTLISNTVLLDSSTISGGATNYNLAFTTAALVMGTQYHLVLNNSTVTFSGGSYFWDANNASITNPQFLESTNSGSSWVPFLGGGQNAGFSITVNTSSSFVAGSNLLTNAVDTVTLNTQDIGQTFTASASGTVSDIIFQLSLQNASPSLGGTIAVDLYTDNAGQPDILLATSTTISSSTLTNTPANITFMFPSAPAISSGNVYHAIIDTSSIPGTSGTVTWTAQPIFNTSVFPTAGDEVYIDAGNAFANQIALFNGTSWSINNPIRSFDGIGYLEQQYVNSTTLTNNQGSPTNVGSLFSFNPANISGIKVEYYIKDGSTPALVRIGTTTIMCASDGSKTDIVDDFAQTMDLGVTFSAVFASGVASLQYTTTNTTTRTMRARITRFLA